MERGLPESEHEAYRETVAEFLAREVTPRNAQREADAHLDVLTDQGIRARQDDTQDNDRYVAR